jgi:hypothetical protein
VYHVHGTLSKASGEIYTGQWKNGEYHGHGNYTFSDGTRYEGEFKENKRDGFGSMFYISGAKFSGNWKNDSETGSGIFTDSNGNQMDYKFDKKQIRVEGNNEDLKIISLDEYRIRNRL